MMIWGRVSNMFLQEVTFCCFKRKHAATWQQCTRLVGKTTEEKESVISVESPCGTLTFDSNVSHESIIQNCAQRLHLALLPVLRPVLPGGCKMYISVSTYIFRAPSKQPYFHLYSLIVSVLQLAKCVTINWFQSLQEGKL